MRHRLGLASILILLFAALVQAQGIGVVDGRWAWQETARKDKPQTQFSISIRRQGNVVSGVYSVDEFINGEWQGEDGNQTAFVGRIKGNTMLIKFDPDATVPGYQENVIYRAPARGRPSSATLTLKGQTLLWRFTNGRRIVEVPDKLTLRREPHPKTAITHHRLLSR